MADAELHSRLLMERRFSAADDILSTLQAHGVDDHLRWAVIEDLIETDNDDVRPSDRAWYEERRFLLLRKHDLCAFNAQ